MHRRGLLELLARYEASGRMVDEERDSFDRLVEFVRDTPECFERSHRPGHVTGSAWIVDATESACLLTHHRKLGIWVQPGGHADGDPDVLRVALREGREESGIPDLVPLSEEIFDVDVHRIPERGSEPEHYHYDVRFLLRAPDGATFRVSEESHDLAWVKPGEVDDYSTDDSVRRMVRKWTLLGAR